MAKTNTRTPKAKKVAPRTKHVKVLPGQELHIHVTNARGKELGVQVTTADKEGRVQVPAPPVVVPSPISGPVPQT